MRKTIAAVGVVAIVLGGLAATLGIPGIATAQETETSDTDRPFGIDTALADLVDQGIITQDQADRIATALRERAGDFRGFGHRGGFHHLETAAEVIGIEVEELAEALRGGQPLAEVAEANGVSVDALTNALVDEVNARLDQAVEDGKLTAEQAEQIREDAPDRIESLVNGEGPRPGGHPGSRFGPCHGDPADTGTGA